jgi:hypothetical protein
VGNRRKFFPSPEEVDAALPLSAGHRNCAAAEGSTGSGGGRGGDSGGDGGLQPNPSTPTVEGIVAYCEQLAGIVGLDIEGKTMTTLFRMAQGKIRSQRELVVAQAGLVWCLGKMTEGDVGQFLQRGVLSPSGDGKGQDEPYDPAIHGRLVRG